MTSAFPELDPAILERARAVREGRSPLSAGPVFGIQAANEGVTPRQLDVLDLIAAGLTDQAIADELEISIHTVKVHVKRALGRLHAANRAQAVAIAIRGGLLNERNDDA